MRVMNPAPAAPASDPDRLLADHGDALFRYALGRVRDEATAEDLVQETFLAALSARTAFRGESSERTWLIGILRHKLCDHLRKRCLERPLAGDPDAADPVVDGMFAPDGHFVSPPGRWDADPAELSQKAEFWAVFAKCRDSLPSRQAAVFIMRQVDDRPAEEVCQELGITPTNLWVLLHRARLRLRACLEERWFIAEVPS